MRDILFRGKDIKGNWYKGLLAHNIAKDEWYISNKAGISTAYQVRPETIGQYTGMVDCNGTKIFEGDIVSKEFYTNHKRTKSKSFKGVVEYKVRCGKGFGIDGEDFKSWAAEWSVNFNFGSDEQKYRAYSWGLFFDCEVIGNIYDNPELLKE